MVLIYNLHQSKIRRKDLSMRRLFLVILIVSIVGIIPAGCETVVSLSANTLFCGQELDFEVISDKSLFIYTITQNGKKLFSSAETPNRIGAYIPVESGDYVLTVTAADGSGSDIKDSVSEYFTVFGVLQCSVSIPSDKYILGESVEITAVHDLTSADTEFDFIVLRDDDIIWRQTGNSDTCTFRPGETGRYTVSCALEHISGNRAESDEVSFDVLPGPGISFEGGTGVFYLYGGMQTFTIHSGSIWSAVCDDTHFILDRTAGTDGDAINICAVPDGSGFIEGVLTITAADAALDIPLFIMNYDSKEEEIQLEPEPTDGCRVIAVKGKSRSVTVAVESDHEWHPILEEGDANLSSGQDALTIDLPENKTDHILYTHIRISDGTVDGHVSLFQLPEVERPAISGTAVPDKQNYTAYRDEITVTFNASPDTEKVLLHTDWGLDQTADGTSCSDSSGQWQIRIPAMGSGKRCIMLTPVSADGIGGDPVCTEVCIVPEESKAISAEAVKKDGIISTFVITTSSADSIILSNDREKVLVERDNASIDYYIDAGNNGRFIRWMIESEDNDPFTRCRAGQSEIPVNLAYLEKKAQSSDADPIKPYDQLNGTWKYVPYKNSELQTSGCAIFALSTALNILGHTDIETTPARLADKYRFCLVDGGTLNSTLIGNAGKEFGYRTRYDLYNSRQEVLTFFERGAVFSFSVVKGHIALIDRCSEDGSYFHVYDSALSATFTRIAGAEIYQLIDGEYVPVESPDKIEGARFFIETNAFSGGQYWLKAEYALRRGLRLIWPKDSAE